MSFQAKMRKVKRQGRRRLPLSKPQVKAVQKIANKQINRVSELKYHDVQVTSQAIAYDSVYVVDLLAPAQGDSVTTRDGDSLYIKNHRVKMELLRDSATGIDTAGRVLIIQWLEDSASGAPTLSDVLADTTRFDGTISPYLINSSKKFKVLYDKVFTLSENNGPDYRHLTAKLRPLVRKIKFNAGATTGVGKIYLMAFSDRPAATSPPVLTMYSRNRFLDN